MTIPTSYEQVTHNSPDGAQVGKSATEKVGLWGATPVVQPSGANQAEASVTSVALAFTWSANDPGVTDGEATIADGDTVGDDNDAGAALSAIEAQFNNLRTDVLALRTLVHQLRSDMVTAGIIAGE